MADRGSPSRAAPPAGHPERDFDPLGPLEVLGRLYHSDHGENR